jgi:hypothetical protein
MLVDRDLKARLYEWNPLGACVRPARQGGKSVTVNIDQVGWGYRVGPLAERRLLLHSS